MKKKNERLMLQASYASIGMTILLLVLKWMAFMMTNSVAVLSTLFDSLQDLMTSGINLLAVRHSVIPADKQHRFGHGKAQAIGGLVQAIVIFMSGLVLIYQSCQHWKNHDEINVFSWGMILLVVSIVLTFVLLRFQKYVIAKTDSISIRADMAHYAGDIWMNLGVIISLLFSALFKIQWLDILFGVGVGLYLCKTTYQIAKTALGMLMDTEMPTQVRQTIKKTALAFPQVVGVSNLKTRLSGSCLFIQMTVIMDKDLTLYQAHQIADKIENQLHTHFSDCEIILHLEPDSKIIPSNK